jgi:hypothetical protein
MSRECLFLTDPKTQLGPSFSPFHLRQETHSFSVMLCSPPVTKRRTASREPSSGFCRTVDPHTNCTTRCKLVGRRRSEDGLCSESWQGSSDMTSPYQPQTREILRLEDTARTTRTTKPMEKLMNYKRRSYTRWGAGIAQSVMRLGTGSEFDSSRG